MVENRTNRNRGHADYTKESTRNLLRVEVDVVLRASKMAKQPAVYEEKIAG